MMKLNNRKVLQNTQGWRQLSNIKTEQHFNGSMLSLSRLKDTMELKLLKLHSLYLEP